VSVARVLPAGPPIDRARGLGRAFSADPCVPRGTCPRTMGGHRVAEMRPPRPPDAHHGPDRIPDARIEAARRFSPPITTRIHAHPSGRHGCSMTARAGLVSACARRVVHRARGTSSTDRGSYPHSLWMTAASFTPAREHRGTRRRDDHPVRTRPSRRSLRPPHVRPSCAATFNSTALAILRQPGVSISEERLDMRA